MKQFDASLNLQGLINISDLCKLNGKHWSDYMANKNGKAFVRAVKKAAGDQPVCVQNPNGNISERCTWVHPRIAQNVAEWISRKPSRSKSGLVYALTSPILEAVKIGSWRGDVASLLKRYHTYYGENLQYMTALVADCRQIEMLLHSRFKAWRLDKRELFDKNICIDVFVSISRKRKEV